MAAEEAAPIRDEEIVLEDRDYGGGADSYTAVMPSYGVRGGNPRIEYMMRLEESQNTAQSLSWDADNPPAGFISEETAAANQRSLLIKIGLGLGLAGSLAGIFILAKRKKQLEIS